MERSFEMLNDITDECGRRGNGYARSSNRSSNRIGVFQEYHRRHYHQNFDFGHIITILLALGSLSTRK